MPYWIIFETTLGLKDSYFIFCKVTKRFLDNKLIKFDEIFYRILRRGTRWCMLTPCDPAHVSWDGLFWACDSRRTHTLRRDRYRRGFCEWWINAGCNCLASTSRRYSLVDRIGSASALRAPSPCAFRALIQSNWCVRKSHKHEPSTSVRNCLVYASWVVRHSSLAARGFFSLR